MRAIFNVTLIYHGTCYKATIELKRLITVLLCASQNYYNGDEEKLRRTVVDLSHITGCVYAILVDVIVLLRVNRTFTSKRGYRNLVIATKTTTNEVANEAAKKQNKDGECVGKCVPIHV